MAHVVPNKKTDRTKCVASFPSTYHETHDTVLTWVDPPVETAAKAAWASPTRTKTRGTKHGASFLLAYSEN